MGRGHCEAEGWEGPDTSNLFDVFLWHWPISPCLQETIQYLLTNCATLGLSHRSIPTNNITFIFWPSASSFSQLLHARYLSNEHKLSSLAAKPKVLGPNTKKLKLSIFQNIIPCVFWLWRYYSMYLRFTEYSNNDILLVWECCCLIYTVYIISLLFKGLFFTIKIWNGCLGSTLWSLITH